MRAGFCSVFISVQMETTMRSSLRSRRAATLALAGLLATSGYVNAEAGTANAAVTSTAADTSTLKGRLTALAEGDVRAGAPGVIVRIQDGNKPPVTVARQAAWTRAGHNLSTD